METILKKNISKVCEQYEIGAHAESLEKILEKCIHGNTSKQEIDEYISMIKDELRKAYGD